MLSKIIQFSIKNKFIILLFTTFIIGFGLYSLSRIPIGAVPDVTNNQVQVITTSRNLSTQDMEQFITYPVELEMANLPGVTEIRSTSKFGLSVVTIVFEDAMGTFLPRQLIAEKIKSASEKIPEGFGSPEMGPITTGLGEIYQYILDVKPNFKDKYTTTDLRTIQDWMVKRQLSGIPGVVEVNTWGGYLKQYEVAINTQKLNAMNITSQEVFSALEKNNSITGGGYIEKVNQAYFIRGEGLVGNLTDIENIVVKTVDGIPIYIKDIAKVGFGSATRFGAITGNGEGEKVLGQVMMLKDANSKKVIEDVKARVASIAKSLPEGVYINPVVDRSELIGKTTFTVSENLILGCLIVIFVVVLILGNWRSGLVVASVIPLSLLFTLSLMYIFGVDANLMSLGAIDFGIIIDGAVIIVEFITYQITQQQDKLNALSKNEQQELQDNITYSGASKMMNSAVFGQFIILIVFIPILSLQGVEGKMFKPMALTFSFALIGAMLLCFSYVPVISSIVLKASKQSKKSISARIIRWLQTMYEPSIHWALNHKLIILVIAVLMLGSSVFLYSIMGGEFVPTLDEGDFVIQPVLKTGTSLSKTIETTTKIEQILLDSFPEVKQVVSRIGAAEVPTDPMAMEESDVIITLKPKSEWTSASSKDELADKFKEALSIISGMEVEFTQPIEMRFNELITGVRADIAIKIFGEDLNILTKKGNEIKTLVENVDGASDVTIDKIEGLPQMSVKYNRKKIARYGLNIEDVNKMLSMGFSGKTVGNVFEGEKRFDLVVRLDNSHRKSIDDIKQLYIDLPDGGKVQLSELASVSEKKGAAKISRDDTRRRMVVGINVRNRDLQSVVDDVQNIINEKVQLPTGYYITYGGQFENLESASKRLMIVVPIALLLIFLMLYFAFKSVKDAIIIYSAIPLAAVGGVWFLWLRDLPFSISAGVGFIALFGIAVLNGIVLIEHFKELKHEYDDMETLIKQAAVNRMRAVLLTASAAALGFLPMAVSTNAGAEVQRPLATVVIGGLVSSTLLTLIVLPVLYAYFNKKIKLHKKSVILAVLLLFSVGMNAQDTKNLDDLIPLAIKNNAHLKASHLQIEHAKSLKGTAFSLDKTHLYYNYDESNIINGEPLKVFGISQDFKFPTIYGTNKRLFSSELALRTTEFNVEKKRIIKALAQAYYQYQSEKQKEQIYRTLDSLYTRFSSASAKKFELGESNYLEKVTAKAKHKQVKIQFEQAQNDVKIAEENVKTLVQSKEDFKIANEFFKKLTVTNFNIDNQEEITWQEQQIAQNSVLISLEKQQYLPDISLEYFQGTNNQISKNLYGYQIGLKLPLFFWGTAAKVKSAKIARETAQSEKENTIILLKNKHRKLSSELANHKQALQYYEQEGLQLSEEIFRTAERSFKHGEIDFFQYIQSIENAYALKLDYLKQLHQYNETIISINYLTL